MWLRPDQCGLAALWPLRLHPRHGHMRPERPLLRLVEAGFDEALLHPGLERHRLLRVGTQRDQPRALARRDADRIGLQLHRWSLGIGRERHLRDRLGLLLRVVAEEYERDVK